VNGYAEQIKLQNAAHALDRIHQAFRDDDMSDAQLAQFVGDRLREVYGVVGSRPIVITTQYGTFQKVENSGDGRTWESVAAPEVASHGVVVNPPGIRRPAERMTDGSVHVHTPNGLRTATRRETDSYRPI
jgi:hypothetical protein